MEDERTLLPQRKVLDALCHRLIHTIPKMPATKSNQQDGAISCASLLIYQEYLALAFSNICLSSELWTLPNMIEHLKDLDQILATNLAIRRKSIKI